MAHKYSQYDSMARCPFWIEADVKQRSIRCEGWAGRSSCKTDFRRKRDMEGQIYRCCAGTFEKCPLFAIIWKKNEDEERAR